MLGVRKTKRPKDLADRFDEQVAQMEATTASIKELLPELRELQEEEKTMEELDGV